jgi:hypothetical protein
VPKSAPGKVCCADGDKQNRKNPRLYNGDFFVILRTVEAAKLFPGALATTVCAAKLLARSLDTFRFFLFFLPHDCKPKTNVVC